MGQVAKDLPAAPDVPGESAAPVADDLLAQLAGEDIDRMLAEADVETTPGATAAPVDSAALNSAASEPAADSTSGEKSTLNDEGAKAGVVAAEDDDSLPFYLRFLEFVNSPLDAFPDSVREIIGKIALVTLINSIAVIGYVLLFRKK